MSQSVRESVLGGEPDSPPADHFKCEACKEMCVYEKHHAECTSCDRHECEQCAGRIISTCQMCNAAVCHKCVNYRLLAVAHDSEPSKKIDQNYPTVWWSQSVNDEGTEEAMRLCRGCDKDTIKCPGCKRKWCAWSGMPDVNHLKGKPEAEPTGHQLICHRPGYASAYYRLRCNMCYLDVKAKCTGCLRNDAYDAVKRNECKRERKTPYGRN